MLTNLSKRFVAAFLLCTAIYTPAIQTSFYQTIGKAALQAETSLHQETKQTRPNLDSSSASAEEEKVDLTVTTPTKSEELELWFQLLEQAYDQIPQTRIITDDVVEKLNLLSGSGADKAYCVRNLFPVKSTVGKAGIAQELAVGTNGIRNQQIIRYFAENPAAATRVSHALQKINDGMGLYLTFFKDMSKAEKEAFATPFFGSWLSATANKSVAALAGLRLFQRGWNAIGFTPFITIGKWYTANKISSYIAGNEIKALGLNIELESSSIFGTAWKSFKNGCLDTAIGHYPLAYSTEISDKEIDLNPISVMQRIAQGELPDYSTDLGDKRFLNFDGKKRYWSLADNLRWANGSKPSLGYLAATYAFADLAHGYMAYRSTQNIQFDNTILENLQTRLMGVASIVEGLEELNAVAAESSLQELTDLAQDISILLQNAENSTDLGYLVSHLQTNTFKGDPSYWSNRPRIQATYTLLQDNKMALVPALRAAGTIDALHAAYQLVTEQADKRAEYCFVDFVDNDQPIIDLQNFWNPLIDPEKVVLNSVHLGDGGDHNMLLTGPNGSGKSGNMTGIALCGVALPHALGIAPAAQARITPFTHINTYLNEKEDLQQELSTFMAEAKKLDDICNHIAGLKKNEKCFSIMDEMLKGTVEEAGSTRVYEAGLKLAGQQQSIVVMATHFEKPTDLQADTDSGFVNYHVGLVEPEFGAFKRTFELVRGANLWWFQDSAKRKRFIDWLTALNS